MTAQIHPFPKSLPGSLGQRLRPVSSYPSETSAGVVHAVAPLGHAEAIPAAFSFLSGFKGSDHTQDNLRHGRAVVTEFRCGVSERRDFLTRAEQIRVAAILAERATADLLARAIHLLNSLTPHGGDTTMMELQRASKSLRESSSHVLA